MKILFILLAVINLLVFGLQYQRQHQAPKRDVELDLPSGVMRLQLVHERVSVETNVDVETETEVDPVDTVDGAGERLAGNPDMSGPPAGVGEQRPLEVPVPDSAKQPTQTTASTTEPEQAVETAPESSAGLPDVDLPESASEGQVGMLPDAPIQPELAEPAASPLRCYTLGGFKNQSDVETVAERLESLVSDLGGREETQEKQIGYWVLIPAQGSRQAARAKVKELRDAGIEDVWRFTKGDLANAISLGLFSNRAPAERHQRAVRRKGFATEIQPRVIDETSYWLDFRSADEPALPAGVQTELSQSYAGVSLSSRQCPSDVDL